MIRQLLQSLLWKADRLARRAHCLWLSWLLDAPSLQVGRGSVIRGGASLKIGKRFYANGQVWIEALRNYQQQRFQPLLTIGADVSASNDLHITCINLVEIGDGVLFGSGVLISDHQHGCYDRDPVSTMAMLPAKRALHSKGPVRIGSRAWIGDHVAIMDNVTIGEGCVIGANSVVTHDIPSYCIAAGVPARVIKQLDPELNIWRRIA